MLPSTGYFRTLQCPFYDMGFCERPYCHYRHRQPDENLHSLSPSASEPKKEYTEDAVDVKDVKPDPDAKGELAADEEKAPVAPPAPAGPDLQHLVEEAVRKVLLGGGLAGSLSPSKLLGSIDTAAVVSKIKEERQDSDEDVCIIEDTSEDLARPGPSGLTPAAGYKTEAGSRETEETSPTKPRLYIPSADCPAYNPTPIKELEKRAHSAPGILPSIVKASSLTEAKSALVPRITSATRKTFSYTPSNAQTSGSGVLGDIGDLSESDTEQETPDLIGNILKDGNKTGVLAGGVVSEFQERLISEKLKLARKKSSGQNTQVDQVSSSSPGQAEASGDLKDKETDTSATDNTEVDDIEQDDEKTLKAQEEEIEKLEKKRKILEDYYKKKVEEKRKSGENEQMLKDLKEIKNKENKRVRSSPNQSKKKRKKHSSSESESGDSDSESSDSSRRRRRHKSKHSKHRKSSKRHKSRERSSHRSSRNKKRSRKETTSSESESSEDDMEERRKLIKAQKESKSQEIPEKVSSALSAPSQKPPMNEIQSQSEHPLKTPSESPIAETEAAPISALDAFKNAEIEIRKLLVGSKPEDDVPQIKIKPLGQLVTTENEPPNENMDIPQDNDQDDFEEQNGSFMDALQVLDDKPEKSPKKSSHKSSHSHKSSKSSHHEKSHKSSSHKSSSRDKSSSHKSSSKDKSSSHKSSSKDKLDSHRSSSKDKSDSHKSSNKEKTSSHKSSNKEKTSSHKSSSKDKSSSDKSSRTSDQKSSSSKHKSSSSSKHKSSKDKNRERDREKDDDFKDNEGKSPVPDFSEELAMLPDLMDEDVDDFDNVADGLEEMFAGVEDEDELQRVFEQYEPDLSNFTDEAALRKQRQLEEKERARAEPSSSSSSALAKKRLAHEGAQTSEKRPLHMRKPSHRTPAQVMADRYKKLQMMRQQQMIEKRMTEMTEEDPGEGPSTSTSSGLGSSQPGGARSRVAHTVTSGQSPAVLSKAKQQLAAREKAKEVMKQTPAITNVKGTQRKAHTPSSSVVRKPFVTPDPKSKVPTTVRQKYLDTIITECLKITGGEELEAYTRAEREEANCCRKASSRMLYLNLVVSTIKKLRAEATAAAASAQHRKSAPNLSEKRSMLTTHLQVLAGKPGSIGTWSIERPTVVTAADIDEKLLFAVMKQYVMTEEQLVDNGYPRPDPEKPGHVVMKYEPRRKPDPEKARLVAASEDKRLCDRCGAVYSVDEEGGQLGSEKCVHHWGRLFRRRGNRVVGASSAWNCCEGSSEAEGCQVSPCHVTETQDYTSMRGFVTSLDKGGGGEGRVWAMDCEMVNTTVGSELVRVTLINHAGDTEYESLVMPDNKILDYNTRFSGIKEADLAGVTTRLRDVQAQLLFKIEARDIMIGHSLESDLRAVKLLHSVVVDTAVVFPHKMGPPYKRALRTLAVEQIQRIIQNDDGDGHDSKEDALACLDIMKLKVVGDVSKLQTQARANTSKRRDSFLTDPANVKL